MVLTWRPKRRSLDGRHVVVVGATSGIGRATAVALAAHHGRLVLAARSADELDEVAAACRSAGARSVATLAVDIGRSDGVDALADLARRELGTVDAWVNLASVLLAGDLEASPAADIERLLDTNVLGPTLLSRAALQLFDAQGHGTLVNVSSLLGVVPNPLVPVYCTSKFAITGLTRCLQQTPRPRSIAVCLVEPGPVDTPIFAHAGNHSGRRLRAIPPPASPWRAAAAVVACVRRPRRTMTTGVTGRALLIGHRLAPQLTEWVVARYSARLVVTKDPAGPTPGTLFEPPAAGAVAGGYRHGTLRRRLGDRLGRWSLARP